jgi:alpha-ketoglutarate-dependent taurine dioxygenase
VTSATTDTVGIRVRRVAGYLGAEIEGLSLDEASDAALAAPPAALLEHQVLFLRG